MKVVVTGGLGFLGGAVVTELQRRGDEVVVYDCAEPRRDAWGLDVDVVRGSILDAEALRAACEGVDEIYHLAGELGTSELEDSPVVAVEVNVIGSVHVFEAAVRAGVPRVFFPGKPNVWRNVYSITKDCAGQFAALYAERYDLSVRSLCFFNGYGPRQHLSPVRKLVPTLAVQALRGQPLEVFGDGEQTVDMIFSVDLAALTVAYTRADAVPGGVVPECGRGVPLTVNQVAGMINEVVGSRAGVRHVPMRTGETPGTTLVADPSALLAHVGSFSFSDWETSLAETVAWYARLPPQELDEALVRHGLG